MARYLSAVASLLSVPALAGTTAPLDSTHAAKLFNDWFTGHGSADGVVIRQAKELELWCGTDCFKGRPDCTLSASYANLDIGTSKTTGEFFGVFYFSDMVGFVFNSTLVQEELARCYYVGDGMTWARYNGGCGCKAPKADQNCKSAHSPYANVGPDGKVVDGDTPEAAKCKCTDDQALPPKDGCFWPGPAYNTSARPGPSEFPEFVAQSHLSPVSSEVVLDVLRLKRALAADPASAILGVFYIKRQAFESYPKMSAKHNLGVAHGLQDTIKGKYGVVLPIVGLDMDAKLSRDRGPFFAHDGASVSAAEAIVV